MTRWTEYGLDNVVTGEPYAIFRPKHYVAPGSRIGILYCHGAGGSPTEPLTKGGVIEALAALASAGHTILAADLAGGAWGNDTAMNAMNTARAYLQGPLGAKAGRIVTMGISMGGCNSLIWAANNPTAIACVIAGIPVVDLTDMHTNNTAGSAAAIDMGYPPSGWDEATYGANHNPMTMAQAGAFASIPVRTYYGIYDDICILERQQAFVAASGATGTQFMGGHDSATLSQWNTDELVAFVAAHE